MPDLILRNNKRIFCIFINFLMQFSNLTISSSTISMHKIIVFIRLQSMWFTMNETSKKLVVMVVSFVHYVKHKILEINWVRVCCFFDWKRNKIYPHIRSQCLMPVQFGRYFVISRCYTEIHKNLQMADTCKITIKKPIQKGYSNK